MFFLLSKLFWALASPGNLLLVLLVGGLVLQVRARWRRLGQGLTAAAALALVLLATLPVGDVLLKTLERRFPAVALPERVDGIIVLGGSVEQTVTAEWGAPAVGDAAERLIEFAHLARSHPQARLVFTGGSGRALEQDLKEAPVAAEVLRRMGLDTGRVVFEGESRNTWENAVFSRDLVQPQPGETWVLVTSAMHMPRAMGIFRRIGWPVVPCPVDYRTEEVSPRFDLLAGLALATLGLREWIGLAAYWLSGRTDALFPSPA